MFSLDPRTMTNNASARNPSLAPKTAWQDPKKVAGVGPKDGSPQDRANAAGAVNVADALKRQAALREQFGQASGAMDFQKLIEAIQARGMGGMPAATLPTMPATPAMPAAMPALPQMPAMQPPTAAQYMQGPMLAPMQAALARRA